MSIDQAIQAYIESAHCYNAAAGLAEYRGYTEDIEIPILAVGWEIIRAAGCEVELLSAKEARAAIVKGVVRHAKEVIPSSIRWDIWERDDFTCQHCGTRRDLSVDHILAESKGGTLVSENLQTLCRPCNSRKGAR